MEQVQTQKTLAEKQALEKALNKEAEVKDRLEKFEQEKRSQSQQRQNDAADRQAKIDFTMLRKEQKIEENRT